jgi:hypothetical protein
MKTKHYTQVSETSDLPCFLRFRHSALLKGDTVGNVGNTYRFPTFLRPLLPTRLKGAE